MKEDLRPEPIAQKVIKAIVEHYGFTPKQIGEKIGIPKSSQIYNMYNGVTDTVSNKYADALKTAFPELNRNWIITGRGKMFIADAPEEEADTRTLLSALHTQNIMILDLSAEVKRLSRLVVDMHETIKQLKK